MLLLVVVRLLAALLPYRLLTPEWYVNAGLELVNSSPVLMVGFLLLAAATWLNALYGQIQPGRVVANAVLRFALQASLWAYLLLIPLQPLASVLADLNHQDRVRREWATVREQFSNARQQQLSPQQLEQLEQLESQLQEQRDQDGRVLRFNLWRDGLRVTISAAAVVWVLRLAGKVIYGV